MILYVWQYTATGFKKTAVIDNAVSVIWIKRVQSCGEFELYLAANRELFKVFDGECIVTRDDDDCVMWVENITLTTDFELGDHLKITGRSAESIFARRVVSSQTRLTGTAENCIRRLITENLISPSDPTRTIDFVTLEPVRGFAETIDKQLTGTNLLVAISEICTSNDYGFKLTMDSANKFVFHLYRGTNRSYNQSENPYVVFSPEFDNLGNTEYDTITTEFATVAIVAGEGEGTSRKIQRVNSGNATGLNVREIWIDARDISSNNGEISESDYSGLLTTRGRDELEKHRPSTQFGGEIVNTTGYVYGVDYDLGDTVSIVNEYGVSGNAQIVEITEVEDESGHRIVPTLSEWGVNNILRDVDGHILRDVNGFILVEGGN